MVMVWDGDKCISKWYNKSKDAYIFLGHYRLASGSQKQVHVHYYLFSFPKLGCSRCGHCLFSTDCLSRSPHSSRSPINPSEGLRTIVVGFFSLIHGPCGKFHVTFGKVAKEVSSISEARKGLG